MTKHSHLGLVLISGPPGTGKSTFCHQLKCHLINSTQKNAISISFDKVIDKELENSMISAASSDWKTGRSIVFTLIALLGEYLNQISSLKGGFSSLQLYFNSKLDKELVSSEYFKAILDNFFHCLDQVNIQSLSH
jgi:KaiC/GvpD/RAD55 family RecA-like ATPase